jgi:hypothetical protein
MTTDPYGEPKFDTTRPHPARRYNYWLGGKDHFEPDRESGDAIAKVYPGVRTAAIENRGFLKRGVEYLAGECGVRQFLDVGTGLPAPDNTHEVAQRIAPESRVVYVDNDPMVLSHARALLTSSTTMRPENRNAYVDADLRDPKAILAPARNVLDFDQPIGLLLIAVLHFLLDDDKPAEVMAELLQAMPAGSYLLVSHATGDPFDDATRAAWDDLAASGRHGDFQYRSREEVLALLDGWSVLPPGLVPVAEWEPGGLLDAAVPFADGAAYGGIALKPGLDPRDDDVDDPLVPLDCV